MFPETHPNVSVHRCEYELPALTSLFRGKDAVICAISVQSVAIQKTIMEAAEAAGVKRFILDEYINSPNQRGLSELEQYRTPKLEMVALAKSMASANRNFTWSALATGNFIDYALKKFPAFGFDIPQRKARLIDDGTEPITAVILDDIGIAVRGILRKPEETANKHLHIRSTKASQKDILTALEEITGQKWEVEYVESKELYEQGKLKFENKERAGMLDLLVVQLFARGAGRSIVVSEEESDNELLGVKEKTVKEVVEKVMLEISQAGD